MAFDRPAAGARWWARGRVRRRVRPRWLSLAAGLVVLAGLFPGMGWWVEQPPRPSTELALRVRELPLPDPAELAAHLGRFRLESIRVLESGHVGFGGFSSLLSSEVKDGRLVAYSDKGWRFALPLAADRAGAAALKPVFRSKRLKEDFFDIESAAVDPESGIVWVGTEGNAGIVRLDPATGAADLVRPEAMRDWDGNAGAEAFVRLPDGRFIVLREAFESWLGRTNHEALLFEGDPVTDRRVTRFRFAGSPGFRPTDMARLPDGRMLILERKLIWPMPTRFAGRIALADPAEIEAGKVWHSRPVAWLSSSLPVDNFEGMAVAPREDGRVVVWVISDDNGMRAQRTLLWRLSVDPADL